MTLLLPLIRNQVDFNRKNAPVFSGLILCEKLVVSLRHLLLSFFNPVQRPADGFNLFECGWGTVAYLEGGTGVVHVPPPKGEKMRKENVK